MHYYFFSWIFSVLSFLSFLTPSYSDFDDRNLFHFNANLNSSLVFSCGTSDFDLKWIRNWFANEQPLTEIAGYRTLLPNGSLSIRVRMEDLDILYVCEVIGLFANDSEAVRDFFAYKVDPIVPAFLSSTVQNVTLDWGTIYTFPCGFAGTLPREETMLLNHRVVTERYHNITESSMVECMVRNEAGSEHDVAYLSITPGSKEWALTHGVPTSSYCQPYSTTVLQPSVCASYLHDSQPHHQRAAYLVARSRLYTTNVTEDSLARLFDAWDELLIHAQSSRRAAGNSTALNTSDPIQFAYSAVRCVELAKRLACVLTYPSCQPLSVKSSFDLFPNEFYRENPICQSHCLAISGLFCMSTLNADNLTASLDPLLLVTNTTEDSPPPPSVTGWSQLTQVPEMKLPGLPNTFSTLQHDHPGSDVLKFCDALNIDGQSFLSTPPNKCVPLSFEGPFNIPRRLTNRSFSLHIPEDQSTDLCVSGDGRGYRGPETSASCRSWDAVGHLLSSGGTIDNVNWPALVALNPHSFPTELDKETASTAACRNPAGLARSPFCIGPSLDILLLHNETVWSDSGKPSWRIILCSELPHCSNLTASLLWNSRNTLTDVTSAVTLSSLKLQVTVACVLLICLLCIISVVSVIWRSNRCGALYSLNSNLALPELDEKCHTTEPIDSFKHNKWSTKGFSDASEQRYVKYRLQWVRRRRRLRQLHPLGQCLLGCWYVFTDWITCKSSRLGPDPRLHIIPPISSGGKSFDATTVPMREASLRANKSIFPCHMCCLPLLHETAPSKTGEHHSTHRQQHSTKHCPHFSCITNSYSHGDEDEFESNALRMQLQKSVSCVANASVSPPSIPGTGTTVDLCKNCQMLERVSHNLCAACRIRDRKKVSIKNNGNSSHKQGYDNSELLPLQCDGQDPGSALTESSLQLINAGPTDLGSTIVPEKLFNLASMTHLLHPKLKQLCYPRSRLIEVKRLAKRSFGWVVLAHAPDMHNLIRRHRMVSVTSADWLKSSDDSQSTPGDVPHGNFDSTPDNFGQNPPYIVVKTLTDDAGIETEANFLREAEVLVELSHANIIRLLGVCLPMKPLSLLLEYMPFGDLSSFLKHYQHSNGTTQMYPLHLRGSLLTIVNGEIASSVPGENEAVCSTATTEFPNETKHLWFPPTNLLCTHLLGIARDACEAMVYLSDNYYVHRDVATRSFLVGNRMAIKLADFFMCRPIQPDVDFVAEADIYLPIRWLPLESILNGLFHVDTDVWSFGVFLWELFTFASEPYADMNHAELIGYLEAGGRLSCPPSCPSAVYDLMTSCWHARRNERPSFNVIRQHLQEIMSQLTHPA